VIIVYVPWRYELSFLTNYIKIIHKLTYIKLFLMMTKRITDNNKIYVTMQISVIRQG